MRFFILLFFLSINLCAMKSQEFPCDHNALIEIACDHPELWQNLIITYHTAQTVIVSWRNNHRNWGAKTGNNKNMKLTPWWNGCYHITLPESMHRLIATTHNGSIMYHQHGIIHAMNKCNEHYASFIENQTKEPFFESVIILGAKNSMCTILKKQAENHE